MHIGVDSVFVVAEMSCNHNRDYNNAHTIIDAAAAAGADAVKVQLDRPEGGITIDCDKPDFYIDDGPWRGLTLCALYRMTYTPWAWVPDLRDHARAKGMEFFASVSCGESLAYAVEKDLPIIKISSFEARDVPLLRAARFTCKPIIVSCGCDWLDAWEELQGCDAYFLYCVSKYPATVEQFDLDKCVEFDGISDHSKGNELTLAAVARGARIVERHLTMDRRIQTPDADFSLEPAEFTEMVRGIRAIELALQPHADPAVDLSYCKSIYAVADIPKGERFSPATVRCIRPGYGLHPRYYYTLLTKRAKRKIARGDRITERDL